MCRGHVLFRNAGLERMLDGTASQLGPCIELGRFERKYNQCTSTHNAQIRVLQERSWWLGMRVVEGLRQPEY